MSPSQNIPNILEAEKFLESICRKRSIAIVGSGPLIHNAGKEIDDHDIVFRINHFDLKSRPIDTGQRISCWVHNGHLGTTTLKINSIPHIVTKHYGGPLLAEFNIMYTHHELDRMYFFQKTTIETLNNQVNTKSLTTGGRILLFLLNMTSQVSKISVFGFTFYDKSKSIYEFHNPTFTSKRKKIENAFKWHNPSIEKRYFLNFKCPKLNLRLVDI